MPTSTGAIAHSLFGAANGDSQSNNAPFDDSNMHDMSLSNFGFAGQQSDDAQAENIDISGQQSSLLYSDFLKDLLFTSPQAYHSGAEFQQRPTDDNRFQFWDTDMDGSLDFTEAIAGIPFNNVSPVGASGSTAVDYSQEPKQAPAKSPEQLAMEAGGRAFSTSVWHWIPTSSDNRAEGQSDLTVSANLSEKTDESLRLSPEILSKRLSPTDRDRVLSVLLAHCERSNVVRIASSFPSYKLMEKFVHATLHFQTVGTIAWLHIPTFSSTSLNDELLSALVAYGAFLSPISATQKLGTAMADMLRHAVAERFEANNANTRDLQMLQCLLMVFHLLFWSGSNRRMELGESFSLPLITMLRRSGAMSRGQYRQITPSPDDTAETLDAKWRGWVEQESRLRIVHHVILHDAQISMTQFINPIISPAEMTLPLPASDLLWSARTADEWRLNHASLSPTLARPMSMADRVRDALNQSSRTKPQASQVDATSDIPTLYGLWQMIWDCQLLNSWLKNDTWQHSQREILSLARSNALASILHDFDNDGVHFRTSITDNKEAEKATVRSYLCLALYAPLRCLPIFAGRDGESEAQAVYYMLQEWTQSREGRECIWHAGQIFRHARALPYSLMQAFFAVIVYHASLTLWSFAIIVGARQKKAGLFPLIQEPDKVLYLDGGPSPLLNSFIALGEGTPAVSNGKTDDAVGDTVLLLHSPGAVMQVGIAILKEQARFRDNNLPRFVEGLVQLMEDLSQAAKSVGFG